MPLPKSDFVSNIWKDGIFGKFFQFILLCPYFSSDKRQIKRWFSAQAALAQSAVPKYEHSYTLEQMPAS